MCVSVAGEAVGGDGGHHGTRNNAYGKNCPLEGRKERPKTILNLFLDLPKAGLKYSSDNF